MSKHLAISSRVLFHLSTKPFFCGVSGMVFSCRMPATKLYILNCCEGNTFALSCLSIPGITTLRKKFFRLAVASLFALSKSTNRNFVYWSANPMQNWNRDSDSTPKVASRLWTPSPVFLLLGSLPLLVLESFLSWPMRTDCIHHRDPLLSLAHCWPNPLDSNDPVVCATSLNCQILRCWNSSWIRERCRINKSFFSCVSFIRVPFWKFMQLFPFSNVKLCPRSVHLETDKRFEEKCGTHKTFLSLHWNSPLFERKTRMVFYGRI